MTRNGSVKMYKFIVFAVLIVSVLSTELDLNIVPCTGIAQPVRFGVEECPGGRGCTLNVDKDVHVFATVNIAKTATSLPITFAHVRPNGAVQFNGLQIDGCKIVKGGCPLRPGVHTFRGAVPLNDLQLKGKGFIVAALTDQDHKTLACFSVSLRETVKKRKSIPRFIRDRIKRKHSDV